jgi:dihydroorotate dehydrogenase
LNFYRKLLTPILYSLDAEFSHNLAILALRLRPGRSQSLPAHPALSTKFCGLEFPNPVGMAAGFDKNAAVPDALLNLGFGFVEIGTVTPRPQVGNPKPRLFRLVEDEAVINRLGFNGQGSAAVLARLQQRPKRGILGVNIGKNRDSTDEVDDYVTGVSTFGPIADYLTINISSPNTPGLRDLQRRDRLRELLSSVVSVRDALAPLRPPILVKIAPDLTDTEIRDISEVALETGIDGLIATNTTLERPDSLQSIYKAEAGGLSGRPLYGLSTRILGEFFKATNGKLPLIGVGGIASGADAYQKIKMGASLVQLYSCMVFEGPNLVQEIQKDILLRMKADGFTRISEAVGAFHR